MSASEERPALVEATPLPNDSASHTSNELSTSSLPSTPRIFVPPRRYFTPTGQVIEWQSPMESCASEEL